jgi:cell division protein FtsI (penicillin-binding protein 3)
VTPSLWTDPGLVKQNEEFDKALATIAPHIGMEFDKLKAMCSRRRRFVWLKRRLPPSIVENIHDVVKKTPGLYFTEEWSRFYALDSMISPVIGLVGVEHTGLTGLEQNYNKLLNGQSGELEQTHDARGRVLAQRVTKEPRPGKNLQLTLDSTIQTFLYQELLRGYEEHEPISASGIVLNALTGEILAMSTLPAHRPGDKIKTGLVGLKPKMVLDTFEPGSTMKPLIYAAMLEQRKGTATEIVHCGFGKKRFGPRILNDVHGYGKLSMEEVIIKSSNIGAAMMGLRLGNEKIYHYLSSLGFGQKNHLPLVGEPRGGLRPLRKWDGYSTTSIPMGHEISVNMIQMVRAYAAVANGGMVIQPCLEKAIYDAEGKVVRKGSGLPVRRVLSASTCSTVIRALEGVVNTGTAKRARSKLYRLAGKTGTTEKIVKGKYVKDKNIGSFVSLAPASSPRIVVMVIMDEPKGSSYGGVVAGPVVRRVTEDTLRYLRVPFDVDNDS